VFTAYFNKITEKLSKKSKSALESEVKNIEKEAKKYNFLYILYFTNINCAKS